jgi:hypothetical protein
MTCRCKNPEYLTITRPLLNDFENNAALVERETIAAYISLLAIEWERPLAINLRKTLFELVDAIKNGDHNG